jgi:hypothetical protein
MERETQDNLRRTYRRVIEAINELTQAHRFAARVNNPDFTARIETLRQQADNLASDINEAAPEIEPHQGLREHSTEVAG